MKNQIVSPKQIVVSFIIIILATVAFAGNRRGPTAEFIIPKSPFTVANIYGNWLGLDSQAAHADLMQCMILANEQLKTRLTPYKYNYTGRSEYVDHVSFMGDHKLLRLFFTSPVEGGQFLATYQAKVEYYSNAENVPPSRRDKWTCHYELVSEKFYTHLTIEPSIDSCSSLSLTRVETTTGLKVAGFISTQPDGIYTRSNLITHSSRTDENGNELFDRADISTLAQEMAPDVSASGKNILCGFPMKEDRKLSVSASNILSAISFTSENDCLTTLANKSVVGAANRARVGSSLSGVHNVQLKSFSVNAQSFKPEGSKYEDCEGDDSKISGFSFALNANWLFEYFNRETDLITKTHSAFFAGRVISFTTNNGRRGWMCHTPIPEVIDREAPIFLVDDDVEIFLGGKVDTCDHDHGD